MYTAAVIARADAMFATATRNHANVFCVVDAAHLYADCLVTALAAEAR